ncbi:MAG: murein L,D-transpeptidase family protein [Akkermansiaceae bacterium]|nr:murein L,D-transpeptidase family protein [Akkermansiaceae bacterium]
MRSWLPALLTFASLLGAGCSEAEDPAAPEPVEVPEFNKQWTPSSERSRQARREVAPQLIRDLRDKGLEYGAPVFIRIFKQEEVLELWVKGEEQYELFRKYPIAKMSGVLGPKLEEGDYQAPEGFYSVKPAQMNPNSQFHLSFNLGYPNAYDRAHDRTGSALMIHGNRMSLGCFAMTDAKVEEIYTLCDVALRKGQPAFQVHSFPFRMTKENMRKHRNSKWFPFWRNLKEGYDWFEEKGTPPDVKVKEKRYVFGEAGS